MDIAREILAVGLVLALLWGGLWALGRRGLVRWRPGRASKSAGRMEVLERVPLSAQHALNLVRVGERALVVSVHPGGCSLIDSVPWREIENKAVAAR